MKRAILLAAFCLYTGPCASAQELEPVSRWATTTFSEYRFVPNIVYKSAGGHDITLDVIVPRDRSQIRPTVIYIHGGGWIGSNKESHTLFLLPYLARGMNAVLVEYRLAAASLAPAAVEDCRCALRWVYRNAKEYGFDTSKLVVAGESAGGHLSLMTGLLDADAGFDNECPADQPPGGPPLRVSAIVNFCGTTDVADLLEGPNRRYNAVKWFGSLPNRIELARRLSPLSHVRSGVPPIITIHGDADPAIPYQHAVRLHEALNRAGVTNKLVTVLGGKHMGDTFSRQQYLDAQQAIFAFLEQHDILPR